MDEGVLEDLVELLDVTVQPFGVGEGEVVDPVFAAVLVAQAVGNSPSTRRPRSLQDRQDVGQGQRGVGVVQLAVQLLLALRQRLVKLITSGRCSDRLSRCCRSTTAKCGAKRSR